MFKVWKSVLFPDFKIITFDWLDLISVFGLDERFLFVFVFQPLDFFLSVCSK